MNLNFFLQLSFVIFCFVPIMLYDINIIVVILLTICLGIVLIPTVGIICFVLVSTIQEQKQCDLDQDLITTCDNHDYQGFLRMINHETYKPRWEDILLHCIESRNLEFFNHILNQTYCSIYLSNSSRIEKILIKIVRTNQKDMFKAFVFEHDEKYIENLTTDEKHEIYCQSVITHPVGEANSCEKLIDVLGWNKHNDTTIYCRPERRSYSFSD